MKTLTLKELKKWKPCEEYISRFEKLYGKSAPMVYVEKQLLKDKDWSAIDFLIRKRLEKLSKRKICMFAYAVANRSLQYAYKKDIDVLKKAIGFAKKYAEKGKVDESAARSAAWSAAESAAWSVRSAAFEKEYRWQLDQLRKIEEKTFR